MSTVPISEDGRGMLSIVDELRNTEMVGKAISLPHIVVVGKHSSRKSSVLHAISGIQFLIDDSLNIQFPTEIILRQGKSVRLKAFIHHLPDASQQRRSDFEDFGVKWQDVQSASLEDIMLDAKAILQLGGRKCFSAESLVLEVCGPDQEDITLIDLPACFVSTQTGRTSNNTTPFDETAGGYLSNTRAVVLAIISGNNEIENQQILERVKLDTDFRKRILGIITDPDTIEPGSQRENECVQLIQQDPKDLSHGWHILRSVKYSEPKTESSDPEVVEIHFFEQTSPWSRLSSRFIGSQALKQNLSLIFENKVAESLSGVGQEIDAKLQKICTQLESLGKTRKSPGELREYFCECARMFEVEINAMLSGSSSSMVDVFGNPSQQLRVFVQSKHEEFANEMFDKAQTWKLDTNGKDDAERVRQIWAGQVDGTAVIHPDIMATLLFEEISQRRGRELSNLLHPDWASTIFRRQAQRWLTIAQEYSDSIHHEVSTHIRQVIRKVTEEDTADRLLQEIVEPALRERKRMLDEKLQELSRPYSLPSIYSVSRKYKHFVDEMGIKEGENEYTQCCNILRSANAFYQVAVNVFTENVVSLGIENCLLNNLSAVFDQRLFYQMTDEKLEFLGSESEEREQSRSQVLVEKEHFQRARDQIRSALGLQRSRSTKKAQPGCQKTIIAELVHDAASSNDITPCSVEITAATPPTTPRKSLISIEDNIPASAETPVREPSPSKSTPSLSFETTPSSGNDDLWSSRHSRSSSSVSSYNKSPVQRRRKSYRLSFPGTPPMTVAGVDLMIFGNDPRVDLEQRTRVCSL